jgi:predicted acetyltransferase
MELVRPSEEHVAGYRAALERHWSPNTTDPDFWRPELEHLDADPVAYVEAQEDREALGEPITLPDGSTAARLPGFKRWIWDGEFAGLLSVRWQPGTPELPPHVLGHVGYSVVPWKRRRGYATAALGMLLPEAQELGLPYLELTTDVDNIPSQKVITANGGKLVERFVKPAVYGDGMSALRWRIALT